MLGGVRFSERNAGPDTDCEQPGDSNGRFKNAGRITPGT